MRVNLKKTLNWTDRVRIPQSGVKIEMMPTEGVPEVVVTSFGLENLNVPHQEEEWLSALVVLEASRHTTSSFDRQEVGSVRDVIARSPIQHRASLTPFLGSSDISFTAKVVSRKDGRLLAEGKNLHGGDDPSDRDELLPVRCVDLGQQIWRVVWEDRGPILQVNNRIHDAEEFLRRDISKSLVPPAAFKLVLLRLAGDEVMREAEWSEAWFTFVSRLGSAECPELGEDWEAYEEWADRVVTAFCNRHALADRLNDQLLRGVES